MNTTTIHRIIIILIIIVVVLVAGILGYGINEVQSATERTENAIVKMDAWLRLSTILNCGQTQQVKYSIDTNLYSALVAVNLNRKYTILDDSTARTLLNNLVLLNKYWSTNPPFVGPEWAQATFPISREWREVLKSEMALLNSRFSLN